MLYNEDESSSKRNPTGRNFLIIACWKQLEEISDPNYCTSVPIITNRIKLFGCKENKSLTYHFTHFFYITYETLNEDDSFKMAVFLLFVTVFFSCFGFGKI